MMRGNMKKTAVLFTIGVCMASAINALAVKENWKQQFATVSDEYFDLLPGEKRKITATWNSTEQSREDIKKILGLEEIEAKCVMV